LKGCKSKFLMRISFNDELHGSVAEVTNTIEQYEIDCWRYL
jgi:hypothetical protein